LQPARGLVAQANLGYQLDVTTRKTQDTEDDGQSSKKLAQALGKLIAFALVIIVVILVERYCVPKPQPFSPGAKIVTVDGDTIRAGDGAEYRLFGIDAPELRQTCNEANGKSWLCGRAAKAKLTTLIKGGNVNCEARATDRYGRTVAVCSAEGVPNLGEAMVRDGYAIHLGAPAGNPYASAETEAKDAKRGIWRGTFERPSDWRQANPRSDAD
jgi:endonuclease YncB( thermonuclease family)